MLSVDTFSSHWLQYRKRKIMFVFMYDLWILYIYLFSVLKLSELIKAVGVDGGRVTSPLPHITTHKTPAFQESIAAR